MTYCIVPRELATELHELLRAHFREDRSVEVVVELREGERRQDDRRGSAVAAVPVEDRRRLQADDGRRVDERRLPLAEAAPIELPPRARAYAGALRFVRRDEPPDELRAQDAATARLVRRFQAGDQEAFAELYVANFAAVYSYARIALREHHEAEDLTQHVFLKVMRALPRYRARAGTPFRAWLFRITRNETISHLRRHGRLEIEDPEVLDRRRLPQIAEDARAKLDWISDDDLLLFIERLPQMQRQAIALRYMLDLSTEEMCAVLDRSPVAVRKLEHRALRFLESRLLATREHRDGVSRSPMCMRMRRAPVLGARRFALVSTSAERGRRRIA